MDTIRTVIRRKYPVAEDIIALELVAEHGGALPAFAAGAHIDLHLPARGGGKPLIRQYSLCNGPDEAGCYLLGIKREPGSRGGSLAVHDHLREGDVLTIGMPRNHFALAEGGPSLLFGAGIGITPLLAMVLQLRAARRPFTLHYFARSPAHVAFHERLVHASQAGQVHYHFGLSPEQTHDALRGAIAQATPATHVYSCGPSAFMDGVMQLARRVLPDTQIHYEYFQAAANVAGQGSADAPFEVVAARRGVHCMVPPGMSIVQALYAQGIEIEVSCEQGVCGTCMARVLEGTPDHRDVYLTEAEKATGDVVMPCCSRALTARLVLDV
ncbi:vanillate O-demethylase oxidoreductase protein VanB [Cupriavidus necator N-1]|uniref:Vanillate O-demethylase oxidoreductase protein VanB n=1 Tax=Cupriavidus necator (strain ATCC 43291 / DSM 13513 / CCUG 52238 / LMG 8453 / N-1) TaxID=1042878 RepID=G0ERV6_CUPNN|nr:PDR/VanB family oxidoreductase [Cupriavidus necator]AEI75384.1 vanillate O-demethylase oxidoreductase protein VanB [Cupriavidus necator N-1]MDX6012471.1 PDR/VanB family oxidoreductase [Cupriavidus necator]